VSGEDVYAAGIEFQDAGSRGLATVWKNGVATLLTDGTQDARAFSVAVSGADVYVAGRTNPPGKYVAVIWKNGVATPLTDSAPEAVASSVVVNVH
jgi:hypothetical protein